MSIINQMLRDLDARDAGVSNASASVRQASARAPHPWPRLVGALLLATAGVAAYFAWLGSGVRLPDMPAPAIRVQPVAELKATSLPAHRSAASLTTPVPSVAATAVQGKSAARLAPLVPPSPATPPLAAVANSVIPPPPAAPSDSGVVKKMSEVSPEAEAQQLYEDAQALRRAGKADAAAAKYRQALERYPAMQSARLQLAGLLQENGQLDAALAQLKTGYELQPSDTLAIAAGRLLADQGQREGALNWLARGQAGLRPSDHALMGALWSQTQRHDEAVRAYQRAIEADPSQGGWLLGLGLSLESLGRTDEARSAYRRALALGGFKPEVIKFLQQKSGEPGA